MRTLLDFIYFVRENFKSSEQINDNICYYKKNNINEIEFSYSITFDSTTREAIFRFIIISEKIRPKMCITSQDVITYKAIEETLENYSSIGMFVNFMCLQLRKRALSEFSNKYINITKFKVPV